jgi:hypothetical protein
VINAAGIQAAITARDGRAVKDCSAPAEQIAEAYVAAFRGEWGDDWLRDNLSLHVVIDRLAGYAASKSGHSGNGKAALAAFGYMGSHQP